MARSRNLTVEERALAARVFGDSVPLERVRLSDRDLGGAVTLALPRRDGRFGYDICWPAAFRDGGRVAPATFVHELVHVWQGRHGAWPPLYMAGSALAQLGHGLLDIGRRRRWAGWDRHRSAAYAFSHADIGRDWDAFNVERQASIVESWFAPPEGARAFGPGVAGGGASPDDPRFPYIRDVIRRGDRRARYRP